MRAATQRAGRNPARGPRPVASSAILAVLCLAAPRALGWGAGAHALVHRAACDALGPSVPAVPAGPASLAAYADLLADFASEADWRKARRADERARHFLDQELYVEFGTREWPLALSALVDRYGRAAVQERGVLPWTIAAVADRLAASFRSGEWDVALLLAADLGHYVGDAHMPLHATANFDGQLTGQEGLHARWESWVVEGRLGEIAGAVRERAGGGAAESGGARAAASVGEAASAAMVRAVEGAEAAAWGWLHSSWEEVGPLLDAERDARAASGGAFTSVYLDALWRATRATAEDRLVAAALALAAAWESAWRAGGSPALPAAAELASPLSAAGDPWEKWRPVLEDLRARGRAWAVRTETPAGEEDEPPDPPPGPPVPDGVLWAVPNPGRPEVGVFLRAGGARAGPGEPPGVLAAPGGRSLLIVDAAGRRVRSLWVPLASDGSLRCLWDGRDDSGGLVASGIYLARLAGAGGEAVGKIVLIR